MEGEDQDSDDDGAFNKSRFGKDDNSCRRRFYEHLARRYNNVHNAVNLGRLNRHQYDKILYDGAVSEQYGLKEGDRFLEIDGHHVWSERDLSF